MKTRYAFTVFTPTFNREQTLPRVYASLEAQTFRDFEWLIIDDGSTDATPSIVRGWQHLATFPIRYVWQPNGGKHRAFNRGVNKARGELFLTLDSDDKCLPHALEHLWRHWQEIPTTQRDNFSAVTALCADSHGEIIGNAFPAESLDADSLVCRDRYRVAGDKWGFQRTELLRKFPFPEIEGENYIPESIVWNRLARQYRTRYVNEVLKIVEYRTDGLTAGSIRLRARNPRGARLYYGEYLNWSVSMRGRLKGAVNYVRFSKHSAVSCRNIVSESARPLLTVFCFFPGLVFFLADRLRIRRLENMP